MNYSINVSKNDGVIYHIILDSKYILCDLYDIPIIDYDKVEKILIECGFNLSEIFYECIPDEKLSVLNYKYCPEKIGKLKSL